MTNPALKADLFISLRDGGGTKPGGILVLNDSETSTLQEQVQTPWISAVLEDKVQLSGGMSVTTDVNGIVWVGATQRSYRVFVPVN